MDYVVFMGHGPVLYELVAINDISLINTNNSCSSIGSVENAPFNFDRAGQFETRIGSFYRFGSLRAMSSNRYRTHGKPGLIIK